MNRGLNYPYTDRPANEDVVDLQKYIRILWAYKLPVLSSGVLFGLVAALVMYIIPAKYEATATLSFENGQANLVEIEEVFESGSDNREYLATQVEIIQSRLLITRVIQKLRLNTDLVGPPANPLIALITGDDAPTTLRPTKDGNIELTGGGGTQDISVESSVGLSLPEEVHLQDGNTGALPAQDKADSEAIDDPTVDANLVHQISRNLTVTLVRGSQIIEIGYVSYSPQLSAAIVNTLAAEYLKSQDEAKQDITNKAAGWLSGRLETLRASLEESERALNNFQRKENLIDLDGVSGLTSQELNEVSNQLLEAKRQLQQASTSYKLVQRKNGDTAALAILPQVQNHPRVQNIRQQEVVIQQQISDLHLRYGPKHPRMIAARNEMAELSTRLSAEIAEIAQFVVGQYESAQATVKALETELDRLKSQFQDISQKEIEYSELQRQVDINRELYSTFLTRVRETAQATGFEGVDARVTDPATVPHEPLDNKFNLVVTGAAIFAMFAACCIALLYELLHDSIRNPDDIELVLKQKMFGLIPMLNNRETGQHIKASAYFDSSQYQFSEAIKTLRTSLVLSHLDKPAKIISVTSSVPGEGKTTTSTSLAYALAQNERVLLIDADLRRPSVGKEFELAANRPGLTSLIANTHHLKDCIYHDKKSNLDVMASGPVPPDAQRLLGSLRFSNSVKMLAKTYDRIIIDTAPVNAVSDALMISRISDSTLYVVKAGSTRKKIIQRGIDRLAQVKISIDGIILNQVDINSRFARSEEFYGYYGGQYGYGQDVGNGLQTSQSRGVESLQTA